MKIDAVLEQGPAVASRFEPRRLVTVQPDRLVYWGTDDGAEWVKLDSMPLKSSYWAPRALMALGGAWLALCLFRGS